MNNKIQIFKNAEFGEVRTTIGAQGEPLFCLADVCKVLGLVKPSRVRAGLQGDGVHSMRGVSLTTNQYGATTKQSVALNFINEPNFYRCIFKSRKAIALRFQDWVFGEVLPAIRKSGGYIVANPDDSDAALHERTVNILRETVKRRDSQLAELEQKNTSLEQRNTSLVQANTSLEERNTSLVQTNTSLEERNTSLVQVNTSLEKRNTSLVQVNASLEERNEGLTQENSSLALANVEMRPKAMYADAVLASVSCLTTTQIAKELNLSAIALNNYLCERRIQFRQAGQYLLYADYAACGLAKNRTHGYYSHGDYCTRTYLVWTERGRRFLHRLVKGKDWERFAAMN